MRGIIKDNNGEYIVDADLKFKQNISENHPLRNMGIEIEKLLTIIKILEHSIWVRFSVS